MNEKRFEVLFYGDVINCVRDETGKEYNLHELISILMEQQATIQQKDKQLQKAKEYFMDYLSREMSANNFSELWDLVIDDE